VPGHGILVLTGEVFNLNWTKGGKGRFFGAGGINLYCDLRGLDRSSQFMDAVRAMNEEFFHGQPISKEATQTLRAEFDERRRKAQELKLRQEAPVPMPAVSDKAGDAGAVLDYL